MSENSDRQNELRRLFLRGRTDVDFYMPPGEYEWHGAGDTEDDAPGTFGFRLRARWTIRGAGMGATVVRLVPREGFDYTGKRVNLFDMLADAVGVSFRDLSIDCNWTAFESLGAIGAIGIGGRANSYLRSERVEIFNHGATTESADGGGAIFCVNILRNAYGIVIRDCHIHDGSANAHLVAISSNNQHNFITVTEALVENNRLRGPGAIAIGVQGSNCRLIGNNIHGTTYGVFGDTGFQYRNIVSDNWFEEVHYPIYFESGYSNPQPGLYRCEFTGNQIEVKQPGGIGIFLGNNCSENRVVRNRVTVKGNGGGRIGLSISAGNSALDNDVDPSLLTQVP